MTKQATTTTKFVVIETCLLSRCLRRVLRTFTYMHDSRRRGCAGGKRNGHMQ